MVTVGDAVRWLAGKLRRPGEASHAYKIPWARQVESPSRSAADHRPTVLVVDDERVFVDTYATILQQSGYRPLKAYSGEQALELIEQEQPDLVFADIVMGPVNGVDVALAAKQRWPTCAILLVTGNPANLRLLEPAEAAGYEFEVIGRGHPRDLLARFASLLGRAPSSPEAS